MPLRDHSVPRLRTAIVGRASRYVAGGDRLTIVSSLAGRIRRRAARSPWHGIRDRRVNLPTRRARARRSRATETVVSPSRRGAPKPTLTLETELPDQDEYEVRVYDVRHGRRLVAAIEIVSPSNKDRPESRRAFVAKVAALLQRDVSVSVVDIVTIRQFNLYADLLELIGGTDPMLVGTARTLRGHGPGGSACGERPVLDTWFYPMALGQPLPTLPIW